MVGNRSRSDRTGIRQAGSHPRFCRDRGAVSRLPHFRVSQDELAAILGRIKAAGIAFRSAARGPVDLRINTDYGGNLVYWNEPDVHPWEMLTVSYARQAA